MCLHPYKVGLNSYPCGKCVECIRTKQMDYAQMMFFQASKKHSCHFVTFTYDDDNLPIVCLNRQSGELAWLTPFFNRKKGDIYIDDSSKYYRSSYFRACEKISIIKHLNYKRYGSIDLHDGKICLQQSLRRSDWRLWLKAARVAYERKHGEKLPDFTYLCVGEYGEKSARNHYHAMFFGLSTEILNELCSSWKKYGFFLLKELPVCSSVDIARCSMYVAKYMNKGCSDVPELFQKDSLMERPRLLVSAGMNVHAGTLNLLTLDGKLPLFADKYSISDIKMVCDRLLITIGNKTFFLGKHFVNKALNVPNETYRQEGIGVSDVTYFQTSYVYSHMDKEFIYIKKELHEPSTSQFKASPLQVALGSWLQLVAKQKDSAYRSEQLRLFYNNPDLAESFESFRYYLQSVRESEEAVARQKRQKDVRTSVF